MTSTLRVASLLLIAVSCSPAVSARTSLAPSELSAAAERGEAEAQFQLARALLSGTAGVPKDPNGALEWMKKAAAQGHADALGGVGYFYARGVAVSEDDAVAVEWFRQGADQGSAKSQLNLGLAVANGRGVTADPAEGLRWIDRAAAQRLPEALYAQAETFHYGQFGRAADHTRARSIYQSAADAGHADAQNNLGVMLRDGLGTDKDEAGAIRRFRQAAERGHVKAQSNLGHTLGVNAPDHTRRLEALKWVMLAAGKGEITAAKTLEELEPVLPPEERDEARRAAAEWTPAPEAAAAQ